jgi:uncharacterized protein YbjT (DUF2867 family)
MRVLVTGGNGDLGRRVVPRLLARGHHVRVGTREPRARDDGVEEVTYHLDVPATARAAVEGVEVVVHLASDATKPADDVAAMPALVAAAEAAGVGHLLYISIVGIDDHAFPYYRAKLAAEQALVAGAVPWTILRATQFHGLPGRFAEGLGAGPIGVAPSGVPFQPVPAPQRATGRGKAWYRGDLHTHTDLTDGVAPLDEMVAAVAALRSVRLPAAPRSATGRSWPKSSTPSSCSRPGAQSTRTR